MFTKLSLGCTYKRVAILLHFLTILSLLWKNSSKKINFLFLPKSYQHKPEILFSVLHKNYKTGSHRLLCKKFINIIVLLYVVSSWDIQYPTLLSWLVSTNIITIRRLFKSIFCVSCCNFSMRNSLMLLQYSTLSPLIIWLWTVWN